MQKLFLRLSVCFLLIISFLGAHIEKKSLLRDDRSRTTVWVSIPDDLSCFPLLVYIDGSLEESVKSNFLRLTTEMIPYGIGVVAVEKRGITEEEMSPQEFWEYDTFDERFQDYYLLIKAIRAGFIPNWNGKLIFLGSSEGGKIVPKLNRFFPDLTVGAVLVSAGGGISFAEEIKYQIRQQQLKYFGEEWFEKVDFDSLMRNRFSDILANPDSLQKFYGKTYRWYASYMAYEPISDLLTIKNPILLIHGTKDMNIPIASAERVRNAFDAAHKTNLYYRKFEEMDHSIASVSNIFEVLIDWIQSEALSIPSCPCR